MLKITNPANGKIIREVESDTQQSVAEKFRRAKAAQPSWAAVPLARKIDSMRAFRDRVVKDTDELAAILTSEMGKPLSQAKNELKGLIGRIDFFLENTEKAIAPMTVFKDSSIEEKIDFEPLGVIANISAWNYPYFVGSNVFVPALLTGNTVLYKPSEFSTLTGLAIAERLHASGIPKDAFIPIVGEGKVGAWLLEQPIAGVFFTGSYGTGKRIAEAVGGRMIKVQLELGGKDPVYIADDVDVAAVAAGTADGAFYNTGQSCCSVERIYVHERIYDAYVDAFMKEVRGFKMGDPTQDGVYLGPLTRAQQIAVLEDQVKDAQAKGGKLLSGGKRSSIGPNYFEPTVVVNATNEMKLMRDESFGPVIGIAKVSSDEEALKLMNDTEYGLTAGVYTRDPSRAKKILAQVNAGSAYWNCCDRVSPRLPWSGRGHSGMGSTLSVLGIQAFVQPKAWHLRS